MKNRSMAFVLFVTLAACAQPYVTPPLAPEHPANASAREAPPPPASVAFQEEPAAATTKEPSAMGAHGQHGMQGMHGMHGGH